MKKTLFTGALLGILVVGLTKGAHAQTRVPGQTPARAATASSDAAEDPMLAPPPPAPRVLSSWSDTMALLKSSSTDLKIAYADVHRAEGASRVALGGVLPTITGSGILTHNIFNATAPGTPVCDGSTGTCSSTLSNNALPPTYVDGTLQLVLPLLAPRAWHQIGTASAAEDVAKLGVEDQKRRIVLSLASTLVAVVAAERIAELNRNGLRVALQRYDLAVQRKTIGGGTQLDVLRAREDVGAARTTVVSGDETLRQTREALGLALGIGGEVGVAPNISLDALEESTHGACKATTLEQRADVAAARGRLDLAERSATDVKWQFSPSLSAQSTFGASSLDTIPNPVWNIQGILSVPIWDGGVRYGLLRQANADAEAAEQRLIATQRAATVDMERARRAVDVAVAQRKVDADTRDAAKDTDELTQLAFRTGQGTSLELVVAAAQLRQAEINLALGDFELVRARIAEMLSRSNCPF